jgi:hypothetical protein
VKERRKKTFFKLKKIKKSDRASFSGTGGNNHQLFVICGLMTNLPFLSHPPIRNPVLNCELPVLGVGLKSPVNSMVEAQKHRMFNRWKRNSCCCISYTIAYKWTVSRLRSLDRESIPRPLAYGNTTSIKGTMTLTTMPNPFHKIEGSMTRVVCSASARNPLVNHTTTKVFHCTLYKQL